MRLHPFHAWRPAAGLAPRVAAPPYDVVNRAEAAELARGNPQSFLHVGRPDIDLPPETDPHDDRVYAMGRANLERFFREGTLVRDASPGLYFYRQRWRGRTQTGIVGCVHIDDYQHDIIRKHEKTRQDKEDDRTRHVLTLNAHAEPVFLAYRDTESLDRLTAAETAGSPEVEFTSDDGVTHSVWRVRDSAALVAAFAAVRLAYVADGHHRSASAWRAGIERRAKNPHHTGNEEYNWFLAVLFPASQLRILAYNRLVKDLRGQAPEAVLSRLSSLGSLAPVMDPVPTAPGAMAFYLDGRWHMLVIAPERINRTDPIGSLDVSLLQDLVLGPILGVGDPRTDGRIDFVGGIRGTPELQRRVDSGEMALGVSMYPTSLEQLMSVADAGAIMPPKSTWFEPKLKSGLFVHTMD
ncbi:MAG TPA: DUF1015 family protein [Gemmatimonadales bacterium]|nr:DUF1015 family protein [Gemmatimonadales bacterium]